MFPVCTIAQINISTAIEFFDYTIGLGVIDPCTQGVACVHARKVVDGRTCCCWTNFGKIMGVCFWNFSDRTIGWGVIDPCTQGVTCVHARKGLHSQGSMWLDQNGQKNASPFSSTFSFGHSKCFIFVKLVFTMCKVKISYDGLTAVWRKTTCFMM